MTSPAHRHSAALNIKSTWSPVLCCWAELGWEHNNGIWSNFGAQSQHSHCSADTVMAALRVMVIVVHMKLALMRLSAEYLCHFEIDINFNCFVL